MMLRSHRPFRFLPLLLLLLLLAGACSSPPPWKGTVYPEPQAEPSFTLSGAGEQPVSLSDFRGEVVLLYFGYTFCPDICPTTMADLRKVQEELGEDAAIQVIMVSVDPARDTEAVVDGYARSFHPDFVGLTGTKQELDAAVAPFGVFYEAQPGSEATGYLVDHTARVFVVDREGRLRLSYPYGTPAEDMVEDLRRLLQE